MENLKKHNILLDILLTLVTFGLYNLWVQLRQIWDVNEILGEDRFSFFWMLVFSLLTLGFYFAYHEYRLTKLMQNKVEGHSTVWICWFSAISAILGFWFITDSYQQSLINRYLDGERA